MKPKSSTRLSHKDLCAIDEICRKTIKRFLQNLSPEKLKAIILSSNYTTDELLPENLRLENLVVEHYEKQRRSADLIKKHKLSAPTPVVQARKVVAVKKVACHSARRNADFLTEPESLAPEPVVVHKGSEKTRIRGKRRKCKAFMTVAAGDLPAAKAFADYGCNWPGCKTRRASMASLDAHKEIHLETFKCTVCKKCFESAKDLRRHCVVHDAFQPFLCDVCGRAFNLEVNLNTHSKRLHGDEEKPFKCPDCAASAWTHRDICRHRVAIHHWDWRIEQSGV